MTETNPNMPDEYVAELAKEPERPSWTAGGESSTTGGIQLTGEQEGSLAFAFNIIKAIAGETDSTMSELAKAMGVL